MDNHYQIIARRYESRYKWDMENHYLITTKRYEIRYKNKIWTVISKLRPNALNLALAN